MELYEKELIKMINSNIEVPVHCKNVIRKTLYDCNMKNSKKSWKLIKILATACASITLTTTIVFAGYILYDKVWKEPQKYTYEEMLVQLPSQYIEESEKYNYISEDKAKENAIEILNKLGYKNQKIKKIELKRSYNNLAKAYYMVKTKESYEEGLMVTINAETGKFDHFEDMELKYRNIIADKITSEEAKNTGINLYKKIEPLEEQYEFYDAEEIDYHFQNKSTKKWKVRFCKKNDGYLDENNSFGVLFVSEKGKILLESMGIKKDNNIQNNEVVISKEDAINIATKKEKEYTEEKIISNEANITIEKMNTFFYILDNENLKDEDIYLKVEDISRKVWKVKVAHQTNQNRQFKNIDEFMKNSNKYYYIDATTGEIIGGKIER